MDNVRCILSLCGLDSGVLLSVSVEMCVESNQIFRDLSNMREFHAKSHLLEVDMIGVGIPIFKIYLVSPKSSEIFKIQLQKLSKKS